MLSRWFSRLNVDSEVNTCFVQDEVKLAKKRKMPNKQPEFEEDSFSDDDGSFDDDDFDDDDFDDEDVNQEITGKESEGPQKPKINKHLLLLKEKLGKSVILKKT